MKVSIIIPVYNVEKYLEQCIMSAINQTLDDIEIIVIDDKSTDSSLDILNKYKEKYNFIKLLKNEENSGLSYTRNVGIKYATGEYLYFLDSDDYIDLEAMEICYNKAKENNSDIITFDAEMFRDEEYTGGDFNESYERDKYITDECISGEEFFNRYYSLGLYRAPVWLNLYNKEFIIKNNLYFYEGIIHEDELHSLKSFLLAKKITYIPQKLFKRRIRNNSIMTSCSCKKRFEGMEVVLRESYRFYLDNKHIFRQDTIYSIKKYIEYVINICTVFCDYGNLIQEKSRISNEFDINKLFKNNEILINNSKKNILIVMHRLADGGAEKSLISTLDNLDYSKYNVDLIVLAKEKSYLYDINKNVNVKYIYDTVEVFNQAYLNGNFNLELEKEYDIEIGYLDIFSTWTIARFGSKNAKKITWIHGVFPYAVVGNSPEYISDLYSRMDKIICVGEGVRQSFIDFAGDSLKDKLEVIYNPMDICNIKEISCKPINYKKEKLTIISVGRLSTQKGFDRLIRVHKRLIDEGLEHDLIILGSGGEKDDFINIIKSLKVEESCKIVEYQRNPYSWVKMSDIFVSASTTEALGLAIMEAMILAKPIVATDTHGARDLLKDKLGLLVDNNEYGLYCGIKNMILSNDLRLSYINNLSKIDKFSFDKNIIIPKIENLFVGESNMISISLCMILKDEEAVIGRCLDCVKDIVDEIIIVDTGSTDRTKEIVKNYTDKIYDFEWIDDFAAARNFSFSKATKEYIFWIDADEVLFKEDQEKLLKLKEILPSNIDTVTMTDHRGLNENGEPLLRYKRNRLVKRKNNFKWVGFIHEFLGVSGKVYESDIAITHQKLNDVGDRNLRIYRNKLKEGHELSTRDIYYYGKELYYHGFYDDAIEILQPFADMDVWVEEKIDAQCKISDCYLFKGDYINARKSLYKTFEYSSPRAEAVYRLAELFKQEERYREAISWYECISKLEMPQGCYGFLSPEYWTWRPHLQLTVCYYQINNIEKSIYHHKKAYELNPHNSYIAQNEEFFANQNLK